MLAGIRNNQVEYLSAIWACSLVVERCPDKTEVEGPIPSMPTKQEFMRIT